ncbi:MAG: glycosyltransferase [Chitinophagales bacterium]|nr:glycosyltransferase [Chitinophagales bacterium]
MSVYNHLWLKTDSIAVSNIDNLPTVSIIIPVRNEELHISALLNDLLLQEYPSYLLEIIVVDDYSDDSTVELLNEFSDRNVKCICLKDFLLSHDMATAYKKRAIEVGIQQSKGALILTTDGDCRVGHKWVSSMVNIWSVSNVKLLTGAVIMTGTDSLFKKFQALDFLGMMGITAAMLKMKIFNMANGANLLYERSAFDEVGGFKGIDHLASGDDMLLVYKIAKRYHGAVAYAKHLDAVVYTSTMNTVGQFLSQRFRWTAKSKDYQDVRMTMILGAVFFFVLSIVVNLFLVFLDIRFLYLFVFQMLLKIIVDYRLLKSTSSYYHKDELMQSFFSSQVMHILYIVFVGSLGNILKFEWKGRRHVK